MYSGGGRGRVLRGIMSVKRMYKYLYLPLSEQNVVIIYTLSKFVISGRVNTTLYNFSEL